MLPESNIRYLETTAETEDEMERRLLLDVIVRQRAAILELLACKDQALLVGRDAFLVLDLLLDIVNGVGSLNFESDSFASKGFDEDLHGVLFSGEIIFMFSFSPHESCLNHRLQVFEEGQHIFHIKVLEPLLIIKMFKKTCFRLCWKVFIEN